MDDIFTCLNDLGSLAGGQYQEEHAHKLVVIYCRALLINTFVELEFGVLCRTGKMLVEKKPIRTKSVICRARCESFALSRGRQLELGLGLSLGFERKINRMAASLHNNLYENIITNSPSAP